MENFHKGNGTRRSESYRSVRKIGTVLLYAGNVFIHDAVSLPAEPVNEIRQDKHSSAAVNRRPQHDGCMVQSTYESWNFNSGNYLFTTDTK